MNKQSKSKKDDVSTFKKFTQLERLVLRKLIQRLEEEDYGSILATEVELEYTFPQNMVTDSKRPDNRLESLDTQTLVYLITSDKASIELRANGVLVLFHKLNTTNEYPLSNIITKEEYIKEAVIPAITTVLMAIKFKLEKEENETYQSDRGITQPTNVAKTEAKAKEHRPSNTNANGEPIERPKIDFDDKPKASILSSIKEVLWKN